MTTRAIRDLALYAGAMAVWLAVLLSAHGLVGR